jgi:hypothetical protein
MEETKALECLRREIARIQKGHETQLNGLGYWYTLETISEYSRPGS